VNSKRLESLRDSIAVMAVLFVISLFAMPAAAQQRGPLLTPPAAAAAPQSAGSSAVEDKPPSMPVEQIIQKFADREAEFKKERDNYTYTQTFVIQTIDPDGQPDGEYRMTSDILFTPEGKRYEKVINAPPDTLRRITLSQQDLDDLEHVQPFVLTSTELAKYNVKYVGRQQLDELSTYVFDVGPKTLEKNQRYFQGRIWVDDGDLNIVKTDGKAVPDIKKHGQENVFPRFETYRENIEGHFWFPTYTRSDDVLQFSTGGVHIRMTVKYANYKRFGSTIKIGPATEIKQ
jgi:predicted small lipoprotein YifL